MSLESKLNGCWVDRRGNITQNYRSTGLSVDRTGSINGAYGVPTGMSVGSHGGIRDHYGASIGLGINRVGQITRYY